MGSKADLFEPFVCVDAFQHVCIRAEIRDVVPTLPDDVNHLSLRRDYEVGGCRHTYCREVEIPETQPSARNPKR